ncbi:MAG: response regulator [Anaerolineales bacterium]|nr:response regulator [Anaerolineales bacterium]
MSAPYALVVDDDQAVAEIFQRALQDCGYRADVMEGGHKAQAQLVFTTPDLVLLDLHIPNLSGDIILRQLRGQLRFANTRVVITTGDASAVARFAGLADQVLLKPIGYEQMRELAQHYLSVSV